MNRWRRPLLLVALLLLAGAVVNVGVAWGIAWTASGSGDFTKLESAQWLVATPTDWDAPDYTGFYHGPGWRKLYQGSRDQPGPFQEVRVFECGLPLTTARTMRVLLVSPYDRPPRVEIVMGTGLGAPDVLKRGGLDATAGLLPSDPVFPGLVVNTMLYAAILALPLSFFPIRRRVRTRRGRCAKCGYDLAGLADPAAACPECGTAAQPPPRTRASSPRSAEDRSEGSVKCWRRPLMLIALLLLAGAVVNVAVAWACAGRPAATGLRAFGCAHRIDERPGSIIDDVTVAAGWPVWAVASTTQRQRPTGVRLLGLFGHTPPELGGPYPPGLLAPMRMTRRSWFLATNGHAPVYPLPGFAINTLFYGAILALPLSFFSVRRRLRARRGRCPKCGYDLAGLGDAAALCPECGAAQ